MLEGYVGITLIALSAVLAAGIAFALKKYSDNLAAVTYFGVGVIAVLLTPVFPEAAGFILFGVLGFGLGFVSAQLIPFNQSENGDTEVPK